MYSLSYFKENDREKILLFMKENPFIILCGSTTSGLPVATHIPVLIDERENGLFLRGHFMIKTDHHLAFEQNPAALAIFNGPHTYVSASWYSDPKQASTWNYLTVHARGKINFLGHEDLIRILSETTAKFENNHSSPSSFEKLSPDYVSRLSKAIVAFEMQVEEIDNVFKLSQNRDKQSYEQIIKKLEQKGGDAKAIADEMKGRLNTL